MAIKYLRTLCVVVAGLTTSAGASAQNNTLNYCTAAPPEGFDPALYTSGSTFDASSRQIYNKLVDTGPDTTAISPSLARRYTVSADGLVYTFYLRADVKFHKTDYFTPSRPLNASDVVFSIERQWLQDHPYHQVSGGTWQYFDGMSMPDLIEAIEAPDDLTVKLTLKRPEAPVIANLGMDFASILSKEYADKLLEDGTPERLNTHPIGTGPFKFISYEPGVQILYQSHENYWAGKTAIDELIFTFVENNSAGYDKLIAGDCHVLASPRPPVLEAIRDDPELTLVEQTGLNIGYLAYNTRAAPFDKVNVRRALNMAINKQAILDTVFQGLGTAAKNPVPPTIWSYDEDTPDDPYDPVKARELLLAEGVENIQLDIWAMPVVRSYNPNSQRIAEMLKSDFSRIGVESNILTFEWGEYLKQSKALDRQGAVLFGWTGDNGDPSNFLAVLLGCDAVGGSNRAQWCHQPFEKLVNQAGIETDHEKRSALYKQAQTLFKQQAPWATIAHSVVFAGVRTEVEGFQLDPFGGYRFHGVSIAQ